jgi:hypothetical protein
MKTIEKKSFGIESEISHEFARRECLVHSQLNHINIIKLYDFTET